MQKFIADVKAKQEKADPIEALEMNDEIAFWEGVKGILAERNGAMTETAAPVAENEMQPVEGVNTSIAEATADAQAFMAAAQANTVDAYQRYLDNYPDGAYRDGARAGVWKIEGINPESYNDLENERSAAAKVLQDNIAQPVNGDVVAPVADEDVNAVGNADTAVDNQGNPIDANGKLIVDGVTSIDEITDEDFENPTRNVQLPALPENVANAIGTEGRPVVIKKNVFEKNNKTHVELEPENSRDILRSALYNPDIVGSTQPIKRPDYKVAIRTGEKNAIVVLDVYRGKDYVEIVGWRMINEKGLAKMQRQAEREGGQFLILSPNEGSAAALSALPLGQSSTSEDTTPTADVQEIAQESGENAVNGGEISSSETADSSTVPEGTSAPGQNAVPKKKRRKSPTTPQEVAQEALAQAEENRRKPLRARAQEWQQKLGVQVNVIESVDEVKNSAALQAINEGERVAGWFSGGKVYVYMPGIEDMADLDKTVVHEVVAHKGLKSLMGDKFDVLCDKVWESMGKEAREKFLRYVNAKNIDTPSVAEMRAAADEYMAYIAEGVDLTDADRTVWQKVVEFFREFLESLGAKLTDKDIENLIKASYANLRNTAGKTAEKKVESRTMFRIAEVNERFNERLLELDKDRTQKDRVLRLGRPSEFLKNAGIIDADIEMEFDKFVKKSSEDYENDHPFTAEDIMDLPKAIYAPIAVFNSTNNRDKVILTELKKDGKNFIVAIKAVERRRKGGVVLEVNEIATLYPKNAKGILSWINNGLIANVDKEKTLDWLEALRTNRGTGLNNQELSDAANVINNFENPSIESENSSAEEVTAQDSEDENVRFRIANRSQEVFVSNARKAVEEIKQEKATPQQWLAMLKKNGGLKAGEDAWMGLGEWLENSESKSLTKQELLDFIDENAIRIEEVEYRDDASDNYAGTTGFLRAVEEQLEEDARYHAESEMYPDEFENEEDYLYAIRSAIREYKEDPTGVHYDIAAEKVARRGDGPNLINSTRLDYTTEGLENKREIALVVPTIELYDESDEVHFGDAGGGRAVAWVRFGETTDSEGNRVLVIDEIQSKRHQDGREKGYKRGLTLTEQEELSRLQEENDMRSVIKAVADELFERGFLQTKKEKEQYFYEDAYLIHNGKYDEFALKYGKEAADKLQDFENRATERLERIEQLKAYDSGVPSAPFEKNWHELAMKRMLRLAAEEGFDKVAWTTGEQQAQRYDMSRQVESIDVEENTVEEFSDGTPVAKNITISTANGMDIRIDTDADGVIHGGEYGGRNIADVVGKELAVKIMQPGNFKLEGEGLRIGGEGMKGFYDRILPSFVGKYTKKWGAKVGTVEMPNLEQNNVMHSVDVTPAMKESVMEGQTMFRKDSEAKTAKKDRAAGKRETAPETASVQEEHQPTVVSSADGAKVLKDLDSAIEEYENKSSHPKTLLGDIAKILNAKKHGSNSQYATFEAVNGKVFTIRLANHNAKTSTFDNHDENEGISIVVTAQGNNGITNDGEAHIVEFFYDAIKLRRAEGKPLVEILKSIKQALYSGEYKDSTGLAVREEVNNDIRLRKMKYDRNGNPIGDGSWSVDYKVDEVVLSYPNVSYKVNKSKTTESVYVTYYNNDSKYDYLERPTVTVRFGDHDSNAVIFGDQLRDFLFDESTPQGKRNAEKERNILLARLGLKKAVPVYGKFIITRQVSNRDLERNIYEVADKTMPELYDLPVGADISQYKGKLAKNSRYLIQGDEVLRGEIKDYTYEDIPEVEQQRAKQLVRELIQPYAKRTENKEHNTDEQTMFRFIGEKGAANLDKAEEATTRLDNLVVAREMEAAGKDAKVIKLATGWERGADGKWRYETDDIVINKNAVFHDVVTGEELAFDEKGYMQKDGVVKLGDFVEDKELFEAYPELRDYTVSFNAGTKYLGLYKGTTITINRGRLGLEKDEDGRSIRSTLAHEIQHAIQSIEGFARGGNKNITNPVLAAEVEKSEQLLRSSLAKEYKERDELLGQRDKLEEKISEWNKQHPDGVRDEEIDSYIRECDFLDEIIDAIDENIRLNEKALDVVNEADTSLGMEGYKRLAGEVESRNVQERLDYSPEQRRNKLARESAEFEPEEQIFIYEDEENALMGSRVDARMAQVAAELDGRELTDEQRAVADVFGGKKDRLLITIKTKDGATRNIEMQQGNELAGAKHSLYKHFGTSAGVINSVDITLIPEVISNGERTVKGRKAVYKLEKDGVKYTVVTYIKENKEEFKNFYSNKKGQPSQSVNAEIGDTQSARITEELASADKGSDNSSNSQEDSGTRLRISQEELRREVQRVDSEIVSAVNDAAAGLNTEVEIVSNIEDVPDARRRGSKGWYEKAASKREQSTGSLDAMPSRSGLREANGKVYLVFPNAEGVEDAVETVLHEVVDHKGLRRLFGGKFDEMLADVFKGAPRNVRAEIMRRVLDLMRRGRENFLHEAVEEYLTPKIFPLSRLYNGRFRQRKQTTVRKVIKGSITPSERSFRIAKSCLPSTDRQDFISLNQNIQVSK